jgi:uncharacterized membrane protein YccC
MPPLSSHPVGPRVRTRRLLGHPRAALAGKTALAALVAWLVGRQIPGASEYSFYAPFGAVATMHPAVSRSASEAVRGLAAIVLGGALGVLADAVVGPSSATLALVVGVGVLLGGLPWLGASRVYVPLAGVFVLLVGQGDEVSYAASYAGLFLLGGVVSIVINAALPTLALGTADQAVDALRVEVVARLRLIADQLATDCEDPLPGQDHDRSGLRRALARAQTVLGEVDESAAGNLRARRDPSAVTGRTEEFRALERAVLLIDDLYGLSEDSPWGTPVGRLSRELRAPMATALRELAEAVREVGVHDDEPGRRRRVDRAVQDLVTALAQHEEENDHDAQTLVVATVVTTLRRTLSAVTPPGMALSTGPTPKVGGEGPPRRAATAESP